MQAEIALGGPSPHCCWQPLWPMARLALVLPCGYGCSGSTAAPLWHLRFFKKLGNLGLPLALFAFGDMGVSYTVVAFAAWMIWSFTFGIWLVSGPGSFGKVPRVPLFRHTFLSALFLWQKWQTDFF